MAEKTPEQIEKARSRNAAIRGAKDIVRKFFSNKLFGKLPEEIKEALKILAPVARQATNTLAIEIKALFEDKSVLTELDIFKALKVGPNEMKAKVNHCLKLATPDERMWIDYDEADCVWTMHGVGGAIPEAYNRDTLIPSIASRVDKEEFASMTINQMIDYEKSQEGLE